MKRLMLLAALLGTMLFQVGCAGDGIAYTSEERAERHRKIRESDQKQLRDDWDLLWLKDRELRTSRWIIE